MTHRKLPAAPPLPHSFVWVDVATLVSSSIAIDAKNLSKRRGLDSLSLLIDARTYEVSTLGWLGGCDMLLP